MYRGILFLVVAAAAVAVVPHTLSAQAGTTGVQTQSPLALSPTGPVGKPAGSPVSAPPAAGLTDDQVKAAAAAVLARTDTNHDGRVSEAEMMSTLQKTSGGSLSLALKRWKQSDINHDGYLSLDEITGYVKTMSAEHADIRAAALRSGAGEAGDSSSPNGPLHP